MKFLVVFAVLIIVGGGVLYYTVRRKVNQNPVDKQNSDFYEVIGTSIEGREIQAYRFGGGPVSGKEGNKKLVFVGAIHGGYEWNTALLSYKLIDYFMANPGTIPAGLEAIFIPVANPDGLYRVVGTSERFLAENAPQFDFASEVSLGDPAVSGRFNANNVDLNRNFDCRWKTDAVWGSSAVNAGPAAFSEPETRALRDFLLAESPGAVVFFHSAAGGVYPTFCEGDVLPATAKLIEMYSEASDYPLYSEYTDYEVTGDAGDWAAKQGIPSIVIELSTHSAVEFEKNLAGVVAMFKFFSEAR